MTKHQIIWQACNLKSGAEWKEAPTRLWEKSTAAIAFSHSIYTFFKQQGWIATSLLTLPPKVEFGFTNHGKELSAWHLCIPWKACFCSKKGKSTDGIGNSFCLSELVTVSSDCSENKHIWPNTNESPCAVLFHVPLAIPCWELNTSFENLTDLRKEQNIGQHQHGCLLEELLSKSVITFSFQDYRYTHNKHNHLLPQKLFCAELPTIMLRTDKELCCSCGISNEILARLTSKGILQQY